MKARSVEIGECAPEVDLISLEFKRITLSDLLSKNKLLILAFFPAAFSQVCTKELCTLRDKMSLLEKANARVVGISVDSPWCLKEFKEKNRINFELLSDYNRRTIKNYNVCHEELFGMEEVAKRSIFILSREGRILYKWVSEDPKVEPNYEEILRVVEHLEKIETEPCK